MVLIIILMLMILLVDGCIGLLLGLFLLLVVVGVLVGLLRIMGGGIVRSWCNGFVRGVICCFCGVLPRIIWKN